jgi:hypothetical protein
LKKGEAPSHTVKHEKEGKEMPPNKLKNEPSLDGKNASVSYTVKKCCWHFFFACLGWLCHFPEKGRTGSIGY